MYFFPFVFVCITGTDQRLDAKIRKSIRGIIILIRLSLYF